MQIAILDNSVLTRFFRAQGDLLDLNAAKARYDSEEVCLRLGNACFLELVAYMRKPRFDWTKWCTLAPELHEILDSDFPIFPGGPVLMEELGLRRIPAAVREDVSEVVRSSWWYLRTATNIGDLNSERVRYGRDMRPMMIGPIARVESVWKREHKRWLELHESSTDMPVDELTEAMILEVLADFPAGRRSSVRDRIAPVAQLLAFTLKDNAYNPSSNKNKGDAFDFDLVWCVGLDDTFVCTGDGRFKGRAANVKVPFYGIEELNEALNAMGQFQLPQ